ncbi:MAG: TonB-dependent receptor [Chitinophagaceae bacterium]
MMKSITLLVILLSVIRPGFGQSTGKGNGRITGKLLDEKGQQPLQSVSIALLKIPDSTLINGQYTGEDGSFIFNHLPEGNYTMKFSYLGYQTKVMTNLILRPNRLDLNLGDIPLQKNSNLLKTIEVVAYKEKPLIEDDGDKITYNVSQSITNQGDIALDVLGKVPLVTVDAQGNVQLNGQSPLILINGKPSELGADAIMDILNSLPADAIEKIEVMEVPPAKYQAEGAGGVINIILKKGRSIGLTGRASLTAGTRNNFGGNLYTSYRGKNTVISGIFSGQRAHSLSSGYTNRETFIGADTLFSNQLFQNQNNSFSPFARLSIDHDFSDRDNITVTASLAGGHSTNHSLTQSTDINPFKSTPNDLQRNQTGQTNNLDMGLDANYTHKFKTDGEDISGGISYGHRNSQNPADFTESFLDPTRNKIRPDSIDRIADNTLGNSMGLNLDFESPLKDKKSNISFGYRGDFQLNNRNYLTDNFNPSTGIFVPNDTVSHDIGYQNNTQALYADFSSTLATLNYRIGIRGERTQTSFNLFSSSSNHFQKVYWNAFPQASIGKRFASHLFLRLAYNMRVDRPGLNELNPYVYYIDPYNISYGNPDLLPSVINEFRLNFGHFDPDGVFGIHAGLNYSFQDNITKPITLVNNKGVAISTFQNLASAKSYGANLFMLLRPLQGMSISMFAFDHLTHFHRKDTFHIILNDGFVLGARINISYAFSNSLNAEVSMDYNKINTGQGIGIERFTHSLAVEYKFPGNRLSLNAKAIDPFAQPKTFSQTQGPNFLIFTHTNLQSRYYSLTLSYRFDRIGSNNLDKQKSVDRRRNFHHGPPDGGRPGGGPPRGGG